MNHVRPSGLVIALTLSYPIEMRDLMNTDCGARNRAGDVSRRPCGDQHGPSSHEGRLEGLRSLSLFPVKQLNRFVSRTERLNLTWSKWVRRAVQPWFRMINRLKTIETQWVKNSVRIIISVKINRGRKLNWLVCLCRSAENGSCIVTCNDGVTLFLSDVALVKLYPVCYWQPARKVWPCQTAISRD